MYDFKKDQHRFKINHPFDYSEAISPDGWSGHGRPWGILESGWLVRPNALSFEQSNDQLHHISYYIIYINIYIIHLQIPISAMNPPKVAIIRIEFVSHPWIFQCHLSSSESSEMTISSKPFTTSPTGATAWFFKLRLKKTLRQNGAESILTENSSSGHRLWESFLLHDIGMLHLQ